jgi:hypothetical protein
MRRSKLFLTGTLVVAAIAAVAATKGMKRVLPAYYYQKGTACVYVQTQIPCSPGGTDCKYIEDGIQYQAYQFRTNLTTCNTPLQFD